MRFHITHSTRYRYAVAVGRCYNLAHVVPRETHRQTCLRNQIRISPHPAQSRKYDDYFGNTAFYFAIQKSHDELDVTVESEVEMLPVNQESLLDLSPSCGELLQRLRKSKESECILAREYCLDSPMIKALPVLKEYAAKSISYDRSFLASVQELNQRIFEDFVYDPGFTTVATPLQEVIEHKRGVCQDFAHFAIGCLRALGYAARYVSGYLETLPPPGQKKLVGADATHAWFEVYCPGDGWIEFDPTNNKMATEQHIVTSQGRDYSDVAPLRGVIFGGGDKHQLAVAVTVRREQ